MYPYKTISYPFIQQTPFGKVKIYKGLCRGTPLYTVTYISEEGRKRIAFSEESKAHARAEELLEDLKKGKTFRLGVTGKKAALIASYEEALKVHGATIGDAVKMFLLIKENETSSRVKVGYAVTEYLNRFDSKSLHGKTLRHILSGFARSFTGCLDRVMVKDLDQYLRDLSACGRTRNNHLRGIKTFFKWAQEWNGYLPEGKLEVSKIPDYDQKASPVHLFLPSEIKLLLDAAGDSLRPFLALGAFAGIRNAEICRLNWEDIRFEECLIELKSDVTKTKRRRLPVMSDNLVAWLQGFQGVKTGPIVPHVNINKELVALLGRVNQALPESEKISWKFNGLRRSFISYSMAQDWTSSEVAKQCGNSSEVVEVNYKALAMPSVANDWFDVRP